MMPDILEPDLKVVFCGTAMSRKAEAKGAYYTGPGNKFGPTLRVNESYERNRSHR